MKSPLTVDHWLAGLLPSPRCQLCAATTAGAPICAGCTRALPWNTCACPGCAVPMPRVTRCRRCARGLRRFDAAWCPFRFEDAIRDSIHALKYHARFERMQLLGQLLADALRHRAAPRPDLLLPVPLHPLRQARRGYNQSLELARALARRWPVAVDAGALRRLRAGRDQIGLSAAQRRRNLRGAFAARRALDGLHVVLLDDVITTGSTMDALAGVCRAAGAVRIEAWAVAREP